MPPDQPEQPVLRPLRDNDAADVLAAFASSPDMERQGIVRNLGDAISLVEGLLIAPPRRLLFAIAVDDRLVGLVGITADDTNRNGWFWYWMHADFRRRGWTARAAATVANWAFDEGGFARLELGHRADNPGSARVARTAGFVREGVERAKFEVDGERVDVIAYGRLASDPVAVVEPLPMAPR